MRRNSFGSSQQPVIDADSARKELPFGHDSGPAQTRGAMAELAAAEAPAIGAVT